MKEKINLIFDIGFNMGDFTKVCNALHPSSKIIGVEANRLLFPLLKDQNFKNLTLINYLVSNVDEDTKTLHIDLNQSGISTASTEFMKNSRFTRGSKYLRKFNSNWSYQLKVKTITLDKMIKRFGNPEVIKIDVEGYELEVLLGLTRKSGKICFECHEEEGEKINSCVDHLLKLGYKEFGLIGYFDEGNGFDKLTYSKDGDPYLLEPENYYCWGDLKIEIETCFIPTRRVNYGMLWAR